MRKRVGVVASIVAGVSLLLYLGRSHDLSVVSGHVGRGGERSREVELRLTEGVVARVARAAVRKVYGTVTAVAGVPIEGALVCAHYGASTEYKRCTRADEVGGFDLKSRSLARFVTASAPGYRGERIRVVNESGAPLNIEMTEAATQIRGRVYDTAGGVISGVSLVATLGGEFMGETASDQEGAYELSAAPGMVAISAKAEGYGHVKTEIAVGTQLHFHDLHMSASAQLVGVVTDSETGHSVPGIGIYASKVGTNRSQLAESDVDGRFKIAHVDQGTYGVEAASEGWRSSTVVVTMAPGDQAEVQLRVSPASTLGGTVATEGGPCRTGEVTALGPGWARARLNREGVYHFSGLLLGDYEVRADCEGHLPQIGHAFLAINSAAELNFNLKEGAKFSGIVRDERGVPVQGANVIAEPFNGGRRRTGRTLSDSGGSYVLGGLSDGQYLLSAYRGKTVDRERGRLADARHDEDAHYDLTVSTVGRAQVEVLGWDRSAPPLSVILQRPGGSSRRALDLVVAGDNSATYECPDCLLGQYEILGEPDVLTREMINIDDSGRVAYSRVRENELIMISGIVVDEADVVVPDARVEVTPHGSSASVWERVTGSGGEFEVPAFDGIGYTLRAHTSWGSSAPVDVDPSSTSGLEVRVDEYGIIKGRIVADSGVLSVSEAKVEVRRAGSEEMTVGQTTSHGSFLFPRLRPGRYVVSARAKSYVGSEAVEIAPGAPATSVALVLRRREL